MFTPAKEGKLILEPVRIGGVPDPFDVELLILALTARARQALGQRLSKCDAVAAARGLTDGRMERQCSLTAL